MNALVSILWFLARLQLWCGSLIGPFLLVSGLMSFVSSIGGSSLNINDRPVETVSDRLLFVGLSLLFSAICLSYTLYFRKRIDRYRLVKWGYILLLVVWPAFTAYPTITTAACAVLVALFWWREARRVPPGYCEKCRYDLTGNVSGRCPECGEPVTIQPMPVVADAAEHESSVPHIGSRRIGWGLGVLCLIGVLAACYEWIDWPTHVSTRWLMRLQLVSSDRALVELWTRYDRGLMAPSEAREFVSDNIRVEISADSPQAVESGVDFSLHVTYVVPTGFSMGGLTEWTVFANGDPVEVTTPGGSGSMCGARGGWHAVEHSERFSIAGLQRGQHHLRIKANVGWRGRIRMLPREQSWGPYGWLIDEGIDVEVVE